VSYTTVNAKSSPKRDIYNHYIFFLFCIYIYLSYISSIFIFIISPL
jgi:hypothetical protein